MDERRKEERRKGGSPGGLRVSEEDLRWLALVEMNTTEPIPLFNKSRLIALGLVVPSDGPLQLSERGRRALRG